VDGQPIEPQKGGPGGQITAPPANGVALVRATTPKRAIEPPSDLPPEQPEVDLSPLGKDLDKVKNVALNKVLDSPEQYADQFLALAQTYCIGGVVTRRRDGSVALSVIESDLHIAKNGSVQVRRGKSADLDVDPKLAQELVNLKKARLKSGTPPTQQEWDEDPAILIVRVASRGESEQKEFTCCVVAFKFFSSFNFSRVPNQFKPVLRLVYNIVTVTPDGDSKGQGKAEEWEPLSRLGHVVNQLKQSFAQQQSAASQDRWLAVSARISSIVKAGVNAAAAASAAAASAAEESARLKAKMPDPVGIK